MLQRVIGAMVLIVLAGCSPEDQMLPFEFDTTAPVVRTVGSGATVVSSPAGISLSLPAGALPAGSEVMLAKLDRKSRLSGGPELAGDLYLVGFEKTPQRDPSIEFSFALNQKVTAGELVALTPVAFRIEAPGQQPSANLIPASGGMKSQVASAADPTAIGARMGKGGILQGLMIDGTIGENITRAEFVTVIVRAFGQESSAALAQGRLPFTKPPTDQWYSGYVEFGRNLIAANSNRSPDGNGGPGLGWWMQSGFQLSDIDPETIEAIMSRFGFENPAARLYVFGTMIPSYVAIYGLPSGLPTDPAFPLLPGGAASTTFELTCVGMAVPGADSLPICDGEVIDVRAGRELLDRYPASVMIPLYLNGEVTLQPGGVATGSLAYGLGLRTALSSGFTGLKLEDDLDLAGTWSVSGDTLTVGGRRFQYFTPDAGSLVLAVSDSVRIEDKGGADSWQPIQAYVKLKRR